MGADLGSAPALAVPNSGTDPLAGGKLPIPPRILVTEDSERVLPAYLQELGKGHVLC